MREYGVYLSEATAAGDPFAAAVRFRCSHACQDGLVFVGYVGEDGEELIAEYRCRRCEEEGPDD